MNTAQIIEKIKKLLRMKRGGTPDEVVTALRLAQELAEKHGIDLDSVNPDDESPARERPISHTDAILSARIQWECKYAALVCSQFFNISPLLRGSGIVFIGTEWDIQIALYVFYFLIGHFRREWKTKRGRLRNRQAFMWGMYMGICSKLAERQPKTEQTPGLVATDRGLIRRTEYLQKHFGETKDIGCEPDGEASAAKYAGCVSGRQTEIRSGVKAGQQPDAAMIPPTDGPRLLA